MRGTPEWTTTTAIPGGIATGVTDRSRQSIRRACPARPKSEASWSISPPGTPVAAISAADANRAASTPATGAPARSARAWVSATASAELDDSPEPTGTVELIASSAAATRTPRSISARTEPATKRPQVGTTSRGSSPPSTATSTAPGTSSETAVTRRPERVTAVTLHARSIAKGRTKPPL